MYTCCRCGLHHMYTHVGDGVVVCGEVDDCLAHATGLDTNHISLLRDLGPSLPPVQSTQPAN